MEADITSQAVGLASNTDFSLWSLFIRADFIVKTVILILIACSIYSWAIIIEKIKLFRKVNLRVRRFLKKSFGNQSQQKPSIIAFASKFRKSYGIIMFKDSMQTLLKAKSKSNLNERLSSMLEVNIEKQIVKL